MNEKYTIRKATEGDIELILKMFDHSRSVMRADGNHEQWVGYPTREDVAEDIRREVSYIVSTHSSVSPFRTDSSPNFGEQQDCRRVSNSSPKLGEVASPKAETEECVPHPIGTFALVPGLEPTYDYIDHGRWIDTATPYSTLHRLAAMPGTSGIAEAAFRFAKERCNHLRVDTHATNRPMHHILEKEGFVYCGIIYMPDGGPRDAYEWWRYDEVPADLQEYVEKEILPRHEAYDAAHRPDHVRRVIARSMQQQCTPMSYIAAAMHDIGICEGREVHHLASGRIIRADKNLRRWFTDDEIELIAQAAEDHRASATSKPRSLLGCIIAEADRDIEPETIVRRTVEYGLCHFNSSPELGEVPEGRRSVPIDREWHWQRTLDHLHEKYAEGGYLKLWMEDSPNAAPLAELRALIKDEARLRQLFEKYITLNPKP